MPQLSAQTLPMGGQARSQARTLAEQYLFQSVNEERASAGLRPLTWNPLLAQAAVFHAAQMRSAQTLSHHLSGEPDLSERAATAGAHFSRVSENVAVGPNVVQMHDSLMRSPHHRENILDPTVNSLAIAIVQARGELWAVEDFARDVEVLSYSAQEREVVALLRLQMAAAATQDARDTCRLSTGFVGERPGFVMRYTTSDLERLPEALQTRMATGRYGSAAVGACPAEGPSAFTSYNLAVLLYR